MNSKLKIITGLISLGVLSALLYQLIEMGSWTWFLLIGIWIVQILAYGIILTGLLKLISKQLPFWTIYFVIAAIAFAVLLYKIHVLL